MKNTEQVKTLPITEDELITLIMNANSLTSGLDAIENIALNLEGTKQHEIEQIAGLIAGMKELADKSARMLSNIDFWEATTMEIKLDASQERDLSSHIINLVKDSVKQAISNESKPYLNRKEIAKYFGVADSTISYWATLGMPVAVIDGRKLYGKQSITNWLKSKEKAVKS